MNAGDKRGPWLWAAESFFLLEMGHARGAAPPQLARMIPSGAWLSLSPVGKHSMPSMASQSFSRGEPCDGDGHESSTPAMMALELCLFWWGRLGLLDIEMALSDLTWLVAECAYVIIERCLTDNLFFSVQLDDWVLCRIYNKKGGLEKPPVAAGDRKPALAAAAGSPPEQKPFVAAPGGLPPAFADLAAYYDRPSDSMPRLHADSSCSEQVLSPEQQFACDREVQSQPKISEWERTFSSDPVNPAGSMFDPAGDPLLQDILMYWGKPF